MQMLKQIFNKENYIFLIWTQAYRLEVFATLNPPYREIGVLVKELLNKTFFNDLRL